jgi:hypothetical protein
LVGWTPFWFPSLFPMLLGSILIGNQDDPGWENQKKKHALNSLFLASYPITFHDIPAICIYIYPIISP